jgi:hypothetical protein
MKKHRFSWTIGLIALTLVIAALPLRSQMVIGQYENEAPVRSWNSFPAFTAVGLGRGETGFTLATDASAALSNPALLPTLPRFSLAMEGYFHVASFFMYGPVNTGLFTSENKVSLNGGGLGFAGLSVRFLGWSLALNYSLSELYHRPRAYDAYEYGGTTIGEFDFRQRGALRNWNIAIARRIGSRLCLGIGLTYAEGQLEREMRESWFPPFPSYTISDWKSQEFRGMMITGGIFLELSDRLRMAAVVRSPYIKKSDSRSELRYESRPGDTDIMISATAKDEAHQPLVVGLGASYNFNPELIFALDATYYNWSKYSLTFFEEPQEREFRDVVKIGIGIEHRSSSRIFGDKAVMPFRFGVVYDPQPMKAPSSSYFGLSFGNGISWRGLHLDVGALLGRESGSGHALDVIRVALSIGYSK